MRIRLTIDIERARPTSDRSDDDLPRSDLYAITENVADTIPFGFTPNPARDSD